jgi:hypothetical protein
MAVQSLLPRVLYTVIVIPRLPNLLVSLVNVVNVK